MANICLAIVTVQSIFMTVIEAIKGVWFPGSSALTQLYPASDMAADLKGKVLTGE